MASANLAPDWIAAVAACASAAAAWADHIKKKGAAKRLNSDVWNVTQSSLQIAS
jgi:hypothetical protein